jgi:hypothetical protein
VASVDRTVRSLLAAYVGIGGQNLGVVIILALRHPSGEIVQVELNCRGFLAPSARNEGVAGIASRLAQSSEIYTMRTLLFLVVGFLLLSVCLLLGRLFSAHYPNALYASTIAFLSAWLVISVANLWVGVSKAGYTVSEELPIFILIFAVPAVVAAVLKWRFL